MWALASGRLVARVRLRPVFVGADAIAAVARMADLVAAAAADEMFVSWDALDLALACRQVPTSDGPCLMMLRAWPHRHVLYQFPYHAAESQGRLTWLDPSAPQPNGTVTDSITPLLRRSWQAPTSSLKAVAEDLRQVRYAIRIPGLDGEPY